MTGPETGSPPSGPKVPLSPSALAVLERLTDPTQRVLAEFRDAMTELRRTVRGLKGAQDKDGECLTWLQYEVLELDDLFDRLVEAIEEKRQ